MKPEKIIEAMNMLDDDLIEQAERKNKVKKILELYGKGAKKSAGVIPK